MSDSFDVTTIIFALLALFVLYKLKSILGTRTGSEQPPFNPFSRSKPDDAVKTAAQTNNVVRLPGSGAGSGEPNAKPDLSSEFQTEADPKAWPGLQDIASADPTFRPSSFLQGSKSAYEMIVSAFAAGDKKTLRDLLATDVYDGFATAISSRESRHEKVETSFVSIEKAFVEDAHLRGATAQVTVKFMSKLITATKDASNNVIDGNPDKVVDITDVWTFSRDASSTDPNWKLIATETGH